MTKVARMYGGSLYALAAEEGLEQEILEQSEALAELFRENPDYLRLLSMQNLSKKERCGLLDEALRGSVHPYLLNFTKLLCENGTLRELRGCIRTYRECYNKAHGIVEATATCAAALSEKQTEQLRENLEKRTGRKVYLSVRVDPSILGGICVEIDGVRLDGTVSSHLSGLRSSIASLEL